MSKSNGTSELESRRFVMPGVSLDSRSSAIQFEGRKRDFAISRIAAEESRNAGDSLSGEVSHKNRCADNELGVAM